MVVTFLQAELESARFGPRTREALDALGFDFDLVLAPDFSKIEDNDARADLLEAACLS